MIGLPPNLFYSTSIPACLLIFRSGKPDHRKGAVLFVDGSTQFAKGKNQNHLTIQGIRSIVDAYRRSEGSATEGVQAHLVDHGEIKENRWDLNIGRYIRTELAEAFDVAAALARLAEAQQELREAETRLMERLKASGYA